MNIKDEIKALIIRQGYTMVQVIDILNKKYKRNDTIQNLSNKLARETIKYKELLEILDVIGLKINFVSKSKE